jgi:hypothetical protein
VTRVSRLTVLVLLVLLSAGTARRGRRGAGQRADRRPARRGRRACPCVTISVATLDGEEIGAAVTDDNGEWSVEVTGEGRYLVRIDTGSLPDGVQLRDPDRQELEIRVSEGGSATALFALGEAEEVGSLLGNGWCRAPSTGSSSG